MSRPRLSIGTFGEIGYRPAARGRVTARAAYRDWDGKTRAVEATSDTARAAERALKAKLAGRTHFQPSTSSLTADSSFRDLVENGLADLDLENRISKSTRQLYERNIGQLVLPVFGDLALREIGVARCDQFIKRLGQRSYRMAKQARVVLRLALELAVRHEVIPRNPVDHVARLHRPAHTPDALTPAEVNAIRVAIAWWEAGRSPSGPKPDGQLGAIIEVMRDTSARIGEVLALRRRDIDVTSPVPFIRTVPFTAGAVRARLVRLMGLAPDALLFRSQEGWPLTTSTVRRQPRHVIGIDRALHPPHEMVDPATAEMLERLFAKEE